MRQAGKAGRVLAIVIGLAGCQPPAPDPASSSSASLRLRPVTTPLGEPSLRRTVYVPVYSSIDMGGQGRQVQLAATVSVRNVSSRHRVVLESVRYYDSAGQHVRDYISSASELPPLATVEFVVQQADTAGGSGANFLIRWAGPSEVDEPLIEAVMVGQSGTAGLSFLSSGRTVKSEP
jgi:hypothetical protein